MKALACALAAAVLAGCSGPAAPAATPTSTAGSTAVLPGSAGLRGLADFAAIAEPRDRSVALFEEVGKVLTHPRCVNCHPSGDRAMQRDGQPHQPLVVRGDDGRGAVGMRCATCHGDGNVGVVPGDPAWHMAPAEMAWAGKSLGEICRQIKDPARNGGKDYPALIKHIAEDSLVAYGWNPPAHLEPAPGNQALATELFRAWVATGAHCPE